MIDRQARAKHILADEFFTSVVKEQQELYINNIINSSEDDIDTRERSLMKLKALKEFIANLESIAKTNEIKEKRWKVF